MQQERHFFQAETKRLLDLMINSVYSNRDIFLRELVSNASDALDKRRLELASTPESAEGLSEPRILLSASESGGRKTLDVSDNGIGMSPEFQKVLFEPFSQENRNDSSEKRGSGLGLAIVKKLVDCLFVNRIR